PRSWSPASTSRRSARWPPKSARSVRLSRTRARASSTRANTSSARKARRSNGAGYGQVQELNRAAPGARAPRSQGGRQRAAAALRVPLVEAHLSAEQRRPEGRRRVRRVAEGKNDARRRQDGRQNRRGQGGRQACRRARRREG